MRARLAPLILLAVPGCGDTPRGAVHRMQAEAWIAAPPEAVFDRVADPFREAGLRREAVRFEADGPLGLGTTYVESLDLGLVNGYVMKVTVTALEPGRRVRLEAPADWPRSFAVERQFLPEDGGTRVIYQVDYDDRVVRDIAVVPVPLWLAEIVYRADMHSYLRRLAAEFATPDGAGRRFRAVGLEAAGPVDRAGLHIRTFE